MEGTSVTPGMTMPLDEWIALNRNAPYGDERDEAIAPFPPRELMQVVSGLTQQDHFAQHGAAIFEALQRSSDRPLSEFRSILDFGCGCGRLARMFKGHPGMLMGCDIDGRLVNWINANLPFMLAVQTYPNAPLPFPDRNFDAIVSVSVFTHMNEQSQDFYLQELARVAKPGARLFLTIHAERAMQRALSEQRIFDMLDIPRDELERANADMAARKHSFIVQNQGHLTTEDYKYGITFMPAAYVHDHWNRYFDVLSVDDGAIHDFQGFAVCKARI
jgi:SAM-dependent methyltransferase